MKNVLLATALMVGLMGVTSTAEAATYTAIDGFGVRHVLAHGTTKAFAPSSVLNRKDFGMVFTSAGAALVHKKSSVLNNPESANRRVFREVGMM